MQSCMASNLENAQRQGADHGVCLQALTPFTAHSGPAAVPLDLGLQQHVDSQLWQAVFRATQGERKAA